MTLNPMPSDQPQPYYPFPPVAYQQPPGPMQPMIVPRPFVFDGGAATYFGTAVAAFLVTFLSLGLLTPWGIVMRYRWRSKHTLINGHRTRFTGSAWGLFGNWIKWWFFTIITIGIYLFWLMPRLTRWTIEHQEFVS